MILIFDCHVQGRETSLAHWTQVQDLALAGCWQLLGLKNYLNCRIDHFTYTVVWSLMAVLLCKSSCSYAN